MGDIPATPTPEAGKSPTLEAGNSSPGHRPRHGTLYFCSFETVQKPRFRRKQRVIWEIDIPMCIYM